MYQLVYEYIVYIYNQPQDYFNFYSQKFEYEQFEKLVAAIYAIIGKDNVNIKLELSNVNK